MDIRLFVEHFWITCIIGTIVNALVLKNRSKKYIQENPNRKVGYEKLFKGILIYGNIPWIVMGYGIICGKVANFFDYLRPKDGNPYVLAFHLSVIILWILSIHWIYFKKGAEFLSDHPGLLSYRPPNSNREIFTPKEIKKFWCMCLIGGIFGEIFMWTQDVPKMHF